TVLIAFRLTGPVANQGTDHPIFDGPASGRNAIMVTRVNAENVHVWKIFATGSPAASGTVAELDELSLAVARFDGAASELHVNDSRRITGSVGSSARAGIVLGGREADDARCAPVEVFAVAVYEGRLSGEDAGKVSSYF